MKALAYEKAHSLDNFAIQLMDVAEPTLRDSDVLVEIHAVGINPGEAFIRSTRSAEPGGRVILGYEFAGIVIGLGAMVKKFKIGDRVFGTGNPSRDGAWAERLAIDHRTIAKIPERLSMADAASLPIGAVTAWEAMWRDQNELPHGVSRVLIVGGAGGVGSMATQLLKAKSNALVIATASRPESHKWCLEMGADLVVDHTKDVEAQLASLEIKQIDLVLSTAKTVENLGWIAKLLRPFGHLSVVDLSAGLNANSLMMKSASLHAEMVFSKVLHDSDVESIGRILESVVRLVTEEKIRPITTTRLDGLTVATMRAAHKLIETHQTIGKIVIATQPAKPSVRN